MVSTRTTATTPKLGGNETSDSDIDWSPTPTIDDTTPDRLTHSVQVESVKAVITRNGKLEKQDPKHANIHYIPYFQNTQANVKNITDSNKICWEREYGERYILCWNKPETELHKDIQLIVVGKIKDANLEKPNQYGTYTIELHIDNEVRQGFNTIWKTGKWGNTPGFNNPINSEGVAKFTAKLSTINREAQRDNLDSILTENDPFPGLYDGRPMNAENVTLIPYPAHEFTEGTTVAVEATVSTYNFKNNEGIHRFGYSLNIREVYWLREYQPEENDESNPTTPKTKRPAKDDLVSPRSFRRRKQIATFDPSSDDDD